MTKSELREIYKAKRQEFSPSKAQDISLQILENLKEMQIWNCSTFHVFVPILHHNEVNTLPLIKHLFESEKRVIVPKTENNRMLCCEIGADVEFESGRFNVPEPKKFQIINPKEIDVVLMPMLICDQNGNRVGYGGGFYDRFLKDCKKNVIKIGLNFFTPVDEIFDVFESDIPIDYCVTGDEIVSFSG